MKISIVVPVLNEAGLIQFFLRELRAHAAAAEIIVADGGSSDGTAELARDHCDQLVRSSPGRAAQMNAGAEVAHGDVFWFLHVDVKPPAGCLELIARAMEDQRVMGGFFRIRIPRSQLVFRLTDSFAHYAGLLLGLRYGDHGFFCRRSVFQETGGFPIVPLMEDADFFRSLRRAGRVVVISEPLFVDPRRFELIGPMRLTLVFGLISVLYLFRVPRSVLQTIYHRACCRSD